MLMNEKEGCAVELRVLRYFLAVAREGNITDAAEQLHITQPTLSRQLIGLEEQLGVKLFNRDQPYRRITLTEAGLYLRQRAEDILQLADDTKDSLVNHAGGTVYVTTIETVYVSALASAVQALQEDYPQICLYVRSGDIRDVEEHLDRGLSDFGLVLGKPDAAKYHTLTLPVRSVYGILMRKDAPLADRAAIRPQDLWDKPLILSRQVNHAHPFFRWIKRAPAELNVVGHFDLAYNASQMTKAGMGYMLGLDRDIDIPEGSPLCFRPLEPRQEIELHLIWKKNHLYSKAAPLCLDQMRATVASLNP